MIADRTGARNGAAERNVLSMSAAVNTGFVVRIFACTIPFIVNNHRHY